MPDKYSYYLDEENNLRNLDHFQALQINQEADLDNIKHWH